MTRIALYVFFHKEGILEEYVSYYLKGLKTVCSDVMLIANGSLSEESKRKLEALSVRYIIRENKGFDFAAWKDALEYMGWDKVRQYDELVLCNCSCYGPVYPFEEMFSVMADRTCDFWGAYRHPEIEGHFLAHLQSYFLVLRNSLICSGEFKTYWDNLESAATWNDAVAQEVRFTRYFEEKGFVSQAYVENTNFLPYIENPSVLLPHVLLKKYRFPFLKRKAFTEAYSLFFFLGRADQAVRSLDILRAETDFPVEMILDDLLPVMQGSELRKVLHHTFILPDDFKMEHTASGASVALVAFSYFEDLMDECLQGMAAMPEYADIYIVVVSEHMKQLWEERKSSITAHHIEIRMQENRGRNENAYWLTCRDVIENYDIICVAHDKKSPSARPGIKGRYFSEHCWRNILKSREYVHNVLALFSREPRLGLLMPPTPIFSSWNSCIIDNEWAGNRNLAEELYSRLNLHVPFDEHPDAPYGTMFWVRGKAMAPFYRYSWRVEDFPEEPLKGDDGTILHALERMYPMIAQEAGYYSGWIMPSSEAGINYDNLYFTIQQCEHILHGTREIHFSYVKSILRAYIKRKALKLFNKVKGARLA